MGCLNEEWEIWKLSYPRYARGKERSFKKIGLGRKNKNNVCFVDKGGG